MKRLYFGVILLLAILVFLAIAYGFYRTWKTLRQPNYALFMNGIVPEKLPEGLMKGRAEELGEISWKGKKFFSGTGINLLKKDGVQKEVYPFKFAVSSDIEGKGRNVIRLDYGQKDNPLWLRFIVDEMVSVGENKYLGAVYITLLPRMPFRMGYFTLEK